MKSTTLALFLFLICQSALANDWCLTQTPQSDPLLVRGVEYPYSHEMESAVFRIYVHRLYRADGSGGISEEELEAQLQYLYDGFALHNIQFVVAGSASHQVSWYDEGVMFYFHLEELIQNTEHSDCLDIYLTEPSHQINLGNAYSIPSTVLLCSGDRMLNEVIVHETGHCLGLYHTFETQFGSENSDGSNCSVAGDLICDTAACPQTLYPPYTDPSDCTLTDFFYNIYPDFDPDPHNYMTYSPIDCFDSFTEEQEDRMFACIEEFSILQDILVDVGAVTYRVPTNGQNQTPAEITGLDYPGTPYSAVQWNYRGVESGEDDIFISISDDDSRLYRKQGVGPEGFPLFNEVQSLDFQGGAPQAGLRGLAVADLGDGNRTELFAAAETNPRLYRYDGLRIQNEAPGLGLDTRANHSTAASWGFLDSGSVYPDLLVSRAPNYVEDPPNYSSPALSSVGAILLSSVAGSGAEGRTFVSTPSAGLPDFLGSTNSAWCDYDEDKDLDLFIGSFYGTSNGASRLLRNDGGVFTNVSDELQVSALDKVTACSWADLNGDSFLDLVVTRYNSQAAIYFNDGNGGFGDGSGGAGPYELGAVEGHSGLVVYNFDMDRDMDILLLSSSDTRSVQLFENVGVQGFFPQFVEVTAAAGLGVSGYSHGAIAVDFGNAYGEPRLPDLYLGRPSSSGTFFYKGEDSAGTSNHFVRVRLDSDADTDNSTGIGATVKVTAGTETFVQVVDGGSMRGGQKSRDLVFGLGDYAGPLTASVIWPSGTEQVDIPLTIDEKNVIRLADITIDDSSVSGKYIVNPSSLVDWEFTWDSNIMGDPAFDEVIFDLGSVPYQCEPELSVISLAASGDVALTTTAKSGGGFTHVMTWKDRPCVPTCNIPFWVKSGHNMNSDQSDITKNLRVRICAGF